MVLAHAEINKRTGLSIQIGRGCRRDASCQLHFLIPYSPPRIPHRTDLKDAQVPEYHSELSIATLFGAKPCVSAKPLLTDSLQGCPPGSGCQFKDKMDQFGRIFLDSCSPVHGIGRCCLRFERG